VFALGKLQEILSTIWLQMQRNKITTADIYAGGIGNKINRVYDYNRYVVERNQKELQLNEIPQKNLNELKDHETLFKYPSIVLASSGMMIESTNSFMLAKRWLHKKDSAIFTVGYMDPSTPGSIVAKARRGDKIQLTERDRNVEVKCDIKNFSFSAHSKREDLVSIVEILKPEKIILVHGDKEAIDWTGASILKRNPEKKVFAASNYKAILFA
jgi:Cft2 family RNA processing exonuclease